MKTLVVSYLLVFVCLGFTHASLVTTDCGPVVGHSSQTQPRIQEFLGIPYAAPPINDRRWTIVGTLHESGECWSGTFNASEFGKSCAQDGDSNSSEDCLFLNIWTPTTVDHALPVMVYLHGGNLEGGSGQTDFASLSQILNVVAVTINYRLTAFGFMALDALSATNPRNVSGNYGFMDQITALRWVQANIAAFGGDRDRVTLFGQSSGGTSVLALMTSPYSAGLFTAAIAMSASVRTDQYLSVVAKENEIFVDRANCSQYTNADDTVACLRALTTEQVLRAIPNDVYPFWDFGVWNMDVPTSAQHFPDLPVIDGDILPGPILQQFAKGFAHPIPFVLGNVEDEADLCPSRVMNDTNALSQFLESNFDSLLKGLGPQVLQTYQEELQTFTAQNVFNRIVSDIRAVCGTWDLAQVVAPIHKAPFFVYLVTYPPSSPPIPSCPDQPPIKRAFHMWDLFGLMNFTGLSPWEPDMVDAQYASAIQTCFQSIAYGELYNPDPSSTQRKFTDCDWVEFRLERGSVYKVFDGGDNPLQADPKKAFCRMWYLEGGYHWTWKD